MTWGLGQVEIHLSLLLTMAATGGVFFLIGVVYPYPGFADFKVAAATVPVIWMASLLVRVAVQTLAIGAAGDDLETVVCPTGNLSTDYERLEGPVVFSYAIAGQAATLLLGLLGLMVFAAVSPQQVDGFQWITVLDFHTGWESRAWASQILWVNGFLAFLHLLPAAPFDMRALIFGWWKIANRKASLSSIYRGMAGLNSHIACILGGFGMAVFALDATTSQTVLGWYAIMAPAVYLLLVSRWERSLACDIDDLNAFDRRSPEFQSELLRVTSVRAKSHSAHKTGAGDEGEALDRRSEQATLDNSLDIDNILRKLHREGENSLSLREKEALLSASRKLQAKRHSKLNDSES